MRAVVDRQAFLAAAGVKYPLPADRSLGKEKCMTMPRRFVRGRPETTAGLSLSLFIAATAMAVASPAPVALLKYAAPIQIWGHRTTATAQSSNWSGYNIGSLYPGQPTGASYRTITGQWIVPAARQHRPNEAEYSASWVGIGGGCVNDTCSVGDNTLIQAGTEQDVAKNGKASYYAWWEIIPEPETQVSLPVTAGNRIQVTITQTLPAVWSIVIKNLSSGKQLTVSTPYTSTMATAEWIEETPLQIGTQGAGLAALPILGSVHFTAAALDRANARLKPLDEIQLSNNGRILATPSAPNKAGNAFNDCTFKTTCKAP
jgi:hypothetical protein